MTDEKIEMSEENLNVLNMKYQILVDRLDEEHEVSFTYFVPDGAKSGGVLVLRIPLTEQSATTSCRTVARKKGDVKLYRDGSPIDEVICEDVGCEYGDYDK